MGTIFQSLTFFLFLAGAIGARAQPVGELRFCVHADPKTYDPLLAFEDASETIRYLTGGVLIRFNRQTQQLEPELAVSWKVLDGGRRIDFALRPNVKFSDGSPFGAADVVAVVRRMMTPNLQSLIADTFRSAGGNITAQPNGPNGVSVFFSAPVGGLELLFDQLAISSARPGPPEKAVLGPFLVAEHKSGQYILLKRNPNYWKTGAGGQRLPYLDSVRLDIQANRETELFRFRHGELHLVDKVEPDAFELLRKETSSGALNAGPSLDSEFFWFNQRPDASFPAYKKKWFQSKLFRQAASAAVNRDDMIRLVYRGYAHAAAGPVSPANKLWFNARLAPLKYDPQLALKLLQQDGFRMDGRTLRDRDGNAVEFSLITNAGNRTRAQIGAMLQQDLMKIGVKLNFLPVEFQSLIERITQTQQYESCLLGITNVDIDPNSQMNLWMSSGTHHAWNPGQKTPATPWRWRSTTTWRRSMPRLNREREKKHSIAYRNWSPNSSLSCISSIPTCWLRSHHRCAMPYLRHCRRICTGTSKICLSALPDQGGRIKPPEPVLSIDLSVDYPQKKGVLRGARMEVFPDEILGLVGQSGSGKSTLALAILRLLDHTGARVTGRTVLLGHDLTSCGEAQLRRIRGRLAALIPQSPVAALNPALRVGTQLREAWCAHSREPWSGQGERVAKLLETAGLSEAFLRMFPRQISVGQAQRVLIVMALLHSPPLLIADEPTSALDTITQQEVLDLLVRAGKEHHMSMLFISHDLPAVATVCHRLAILHEGEIVECGPVKSVLGDPQHWYTKRLVAAVPKWE